MSCRIYLINRILTFEIHLVTDNRVGEQSGLSARKGGVYRDNQISDRIICRPETGNSG